MNEINVFKKATMSSLEIAELTNKNHADVLRDIRNVLTEVGIDESKFAGIYIDKANREKPCFNLPRRECDLIIAGYSAKLNGSYSATNLTSFLAPPGQFLPVIINFGTAALSPLPHFRNLVNLLLVDKAQQTHGFQM
jgi:hypothetical protein